MASAPRSDHTHVLLVRGINVGGHARVPMARLRQIATAAGALEVTTHLNSGNVLFRVDRSPGDAAALLPTATATQPAGPFPYATRTARRTAGDAMPSPSRDRVSCS